MDVPEISITYHTRGCTARNSQPHPSTPPHPQEKKEKKEDGDRGGGGGVWDYSIHEHLQYFDNKSYQLRIKSIKTMSSKKPIQDQIQCNGQYSLKHYLYHKVCPDFVIPSFHNPLQNG